MPRRCACSSPSLSPASSGATCASVMAAGDKHLVEQRLQSEQLLRGRFPDGRLDPRRPADGHEVTREYIVHPGAVVVVPLLPDGRLVMERQYRYPLGRVLLEFPAGKIDPGEAPFATAVRELIEETGYRA